jgi:Periplasmic binding protein
MTANRRTTIRVISIGIACAATAALSACSSAMASSSGGTAESVSGGQHTTSVLAILDTSGADKQYGSQELLGIQSAAKYYNAHGGFDGEQATVTVLNDTGDPTTAANLAINALSNHPGQYSMVFAGEEGSVTGALIPIMQRFKAYSMVIGDGKNLCAEASNCPTEFSINGSAADPEAGATQYFKSKGYTNVGVIVESADATETEAGFMAADLKAAGIKAEQVSFPDTAVNVSPEISELKSDGAQAIFAAVIGPAPGYVLSARAGLSWQAPVVFDNVASALDISKLAPASQLQNTYETAQYCSNLSNNIPGFGPLDENTPIPLNGTIPCIISGGGWSTMVIFHDAATLAKSLDSAALVTATEKLHETASSSNFIPYAHFCASAADHENTCILPSDYTIEPVGTIAGTRLHPIASS